MSDAHAAPGPLPPPPPRGGHGCLWGCLVAVLIVAAAVIGSCSYLGWFWTTGFKSDASLQAVVAVLNVDPTARSVLGDHIRVTGVSTFSVESNLSGRHESFVAAVAGSKASGQISTEVNSAPGGKANIVTLVLTGPDGHQYILTGAQQVPPSDTSI